MADLSITAANVAKGTNAKTKVVTAGGSITAGMPVYLDGSDSFHAKAAQADAAGTDAVEGIALHAAEDGQPLVIVYEDDDFNPGATLVIGTTYVLSAAAAGGIAPETDLANGNYVSVVMIPKSTTRAIVKIVNTGATHA